MDSGKAVRARIVRRCPVCGTYRNVVPYVYGLLSYEDLRRLEPCEVAGCVVSDDAPRWHCRGCNTDFGHVNGKQLMEYEGLTKNAKVHSAS